jgi:uncharacterized membrane protein YfcA
MKPPSVSSTMLVTVGTTLLLGGYDAMVREMLPPDSSNAAIIVVFAAAAISSIVGFAFSGLCGPMLTLLDIEPVQMVQLMAVSSIALQGCGVYAFRQHIDLKALLPLALGGFSTLPIGVLLLLALSKGLISVALGFVLFVVAIWVWRRLDSRPTWRESWLRHFVAGATGGLTGGLIAFPGAFVAPWIGTLGWSKEKQRGTVQAFIIVMQFAALTVIALSSDGQGAKFGLDPLALACVPTALLGLALGVRFFSFLTDAQFKRFVAVVLLFAAIGLMMTGAQSLAEATPPGLLAEWPG